jgi:hypothetical protein
MALQQKALARRNLVLLELTLRPEKRLPIPDKRLGDFWCHLNRLTRRGSKIVDRNDEPRRCRPLLAVSTFAPT